MSKTFFRTFYGLSGNRDFYNQDYSGIIQLIVPEETTNLIFDPSIEIDIVGFQEYNSVLTRDITYQNRRNYSLKVTPNTCTPGSSSGISTWIGALYPVDLIAGNPYTFSVDIKGQAGVPFVVFFWDSTHTFILGQCTYFITNGNWQRVWTTYNEVANLSRYVAVFERIYSGAICSPFYMDGLQLEAKAYPTTYCDGDLVGYTAGVKEYLWNGAPHASTSTRLGSTTSGGKIIDLFKDTNAKFINSVGLGLPPTTPLQDLSAFGESGFYQRSNQAGRAFSITCDVSRINTIDRRTDDLNLVNLVSPKRVPAPQPLLFRFLDEAHPQKRVYGNVGNIRALYSSGLEGDKSNPYIERQILNFSSIEPYKVMDGDRAAELPTSAELTSVNRVVRRGNDGIWAKMPAAGANNGFNNYVHVIKRAPDGKIFFGGRFTLCNGVAVKYAVYWDGTSFTQLSTGFNDHVYDFAFDNDGNVYVAGIFTTDGTGVTDLKRVAKYNIATNTLTAMDTGFNNSAYCLEFGVDGLLYAGGAFTLSGDTLNTLRKVAVWYPETGVWGDMGTDQILGDVHSIVFGAMDRIYIGGTYPLVIDTRYPETVYSGVSYTTVLGIYGTPVDFTWCACGKSSDNTHIQSVYSMAVDHEGNVYAAETPSPASTVAYVKKYLPGGAWENIGYGFYNAAGAELIDLVYEKYSKTKWGLIVAGYFTKVDNVPNYGGFAKFVGNKWCPLDVDIKAAGVSVGGYAVYVHDSEIILSFLSQSTVIVPVPSTTPIVVDGSGSSRTRFIVSNRGTLRSIINITTGDELLFRQLNLVHDEILEIDFSDPNNISLYSNVGGNISGRVHPGSDVGSFKLIRGNNYLSSFFFPYSPGWSSDKVIVEWNNVELDILGEISRICPRVSPIKGTYPPSPLAGLFYILMESGDYILMEDGFKIKTEDSL